MKYCTNSIKIFLSVFILLISTSAFALSEEATEGKELYIDANCMQCHGVLPNFDMKNKKAQNIKNIESWVSNCDNALGISWFPEEQLSVVKYLNEAHYKFENK